MFYQGLETELCPIVVQCLAEDENINLCTTGKDQSFVLAILANLVQMGEHYDKLTEIFHPDFSVSKNKYWV